MHMDPALSLRLAEARTSRLARRHSPATWVYVAAVEVVRANGLEIAYERVGEGPPLVFVHGAASDARLWRPQLAALADEFTVVAWDEPGAGTPQTCSRISAWRTMRTASRR